MFVEDPDSQLSALAQRVVELSAARGLTLATAESCTAGILASVLSRTPGAGKYFHGGIVAHTKEMKARVLGIDPDLMRVQTAVCDEVAIAMALGVLRLTSADLAIAITGWPDLIPTRTAIRLDLCAGRSDFLAAKPCTGANATRTTAAMTFFGASWPML